MPTRVAMARHQEDYNRGGNIVSISISGGYRSRPGSKRGFVFWYGYSVSLLARIRNSGSFRTAKKRPGKGLTNSDQIKNTRTPLKSRCFNGSAIKTYCFPTVPELFGLVLRELARQRDQFTVALAIRSGL